MALHKALIHIKKQSTNSEYIKQDNLDVFNHDYENIIRWFHVCCLVYIGESDSPNRKCRHYYTETTREQYA